MFISTDYLKTMQDSVTVMENYIYKEENLFIKRMKRLERNTLTYE